MKSRKFLLPAATAGILALTDGQVHDTPDPALPAPLHVLIPAKGEETDRRLREADSGTGSRLSTSEVSAAPNRFASYS